MTRDIKSALKKLEESLHESGNGALLTCFPSIQQFIDTFVRKQSHQQLGVVFMFECLSRHGKTEENTTEMFIRHLCSEYAECFRFQENQTRVFEEDCFEELEIKEEPVDCDKSRHDADNGNLTSSSDCDEGEINDIEEDMSDLISPEASRETTRNSPTKTDSPAEAQNETSHDDCIEQTPDDVIQPKYNKENKSIKMMIKRKRRSSTTQQNQKPKNAQNSVKRQNKRTCGRKTSQRKTNQRKTSQSKTTKDTMEFCCEHCNDVFNSRVKLKAHFNAKHTTTPKNQCPICKAVYRGSHELKQHIDGHQGIKSHKCLSCLQTFTFSNSLRRHKKTCKGPLEHRQVHIYRCEACNIEHSHRQHWRDHMRAKHGEGGSYVCTCGKEFRYRANMYRHKKSCVPSQDARDENSDTSKNEKFDQTLPNATKSLSQDACDAKSERHQSEKDNELTPPNFEYSDLTNSRNSSNVEPRNVNSVPTLLKSEMSAQQNVGMSSHIGHQNCNHKHEGKLFMLATAAVQNAYNPSDNRNQNEYHSEHTLLNLDSCIVQNVGSSSQITLSENFTNLNSTGQNRNTGPITINENNICPGLSNDHSYVPSHSLSLNQASCDSLQSNVTFFK